MLTACDDGVLNLETTGQPLAFGDKVWAILLYDGTVQRFASAFRITS